MSAGVYLSLKRELDKGRRAVVVTFMNGDEKGCGAVEIKVMLTEEQLLNTGMPSESIPVMDLNAVDLSGDAVIKRAKFALETGKLQYLQISNQSRVLIEPYYPRPHLIILGGGYLAKPLVEFGTKVGFLTTVVDDRPMYANRDRFPTADKVICDGFEDCFAQIPLNEYSFAVVVTRERRHDLGCLRQILNHRIAYTGMIGSRQSVDRVKEQLRIEGFSDTVIRKLHAPIGLDIGAVTPEEIAISIIAQAIHYRRSAGSCSDVMDCGENNQANWPEVDTTVLGELCKDTGEPRALVTIIDTIGPAPRKAGTKMLVWSYGMTVGSIGGGYAEGEVINAAWQTIGTGGVRIHNINLSGQIAEEEGLVCGGVMSVLIEDF